MEARTPSAAPWRKENLRAEIHWLVAEHFRDIPALPDDTCPLSIPLYGGEEVCGALGALLDQRVTAGRRVREFEQKFAEFIGSRMR